MNSNKKAASKKNAHRLQHVCKVTFAAVLALLLLAVCGCGNSAPTVFGGVQEAQEEKDTAQGAAAAPTAPAAIEESTAEAPAREDPLVIACGRSGNYIYDLYADGTAKITRYDATGEELLVIPEELDGHPVTRIEPFAFYDCNIDKVIIPQSVTYIGADAFAKNSDYRHLFSADPKVDVSGEFIVLGNNAVAIYNGSGGDVVVPDGIASVDFARCDTVTSVVLPNSITRIGSLAFVECAALTSITIPNSVTHIESEAFVWCTSLENVNIPDSVTSIGKAAFGCTPFFENLRARTSAEFIILGNNAVAIYNGSGGNVVVPDGITNVDFDNCETVTSVSLPNSMAHIGDFAFSCCTALASITIPSSVTSIGESVFGNCSSLTSVTIPNSVQSIGAYAFYWCEGLTEISLPEKAPCLNRYAFVGCTSLKNITIPNSVTSIGDSAFCRCYALSDITIPSSVTFIDEAAFRECAAFTVHALENSYAWQYAKAQGLSVEKAAEEPIAMEFSSKNEGLAETPYYYDCSEFFLCLAYDNANDLGYIEITEEDGCLFLYGELPNGFDKPDGSREFQTALSYADDYGDAPFDVVITLRNDLLVLEMCDKDSDWSNVIYFTRFANGEPKQPTAGISKDITVYINDYTEQYLSKTREVFFRCKDGNNDLHIKINYSPCCCGSGADSLEIFSQSGDIQFTGNVFCSTRTPEEGGGWIIGADLYDHISGKTYEGVAIRGYAESELIIESGVNLSRYSPEYDSVELRSIDFAAVLRSYGIQGTHFVFEKTEIVD